MAQHVLDTLLQKYPDAIVETGSYLGNEWVSLKPTHLIRVAQFLKYDAAMAFNVPIDCTVVDYLNKRDVRFEVVWHLYSLHHKHRLRLKVQVPESQPQVPALTTVWAGMNWHEREAYDMYGIQFEHHPNLKRILMYDEFQGYPLRKDYPIQKRQPLIEMRQVHQIPTQKNPPPEKLNCP